MTIYQIHPIVVGTKIFDKGMMTYQHDYEQEYVVPIYAWEIEVIPPGTPVNPCEAYDIMLAVRARADVLIPLHEPRFAAMDTVVG